MDIGESELLEDRVDYGIDTGLITAGTITFDDSHFCTSGTRLSVYVTRSNMTRTGLHVLCPGNLGDSPLFVELEYPCRLVDLDVPAVGSVGESRSLRGSLNLLRNLGGI